MWLRASIDISINLSMDVVILNAGTNSADQIQKIDQGTELRLQTLLLL